MRAKRNARNTRRKARIEQHDKEESKFAIWNITGGLCAIYSNRRYPTRDNEVNVPFGFGPPAK